MLGCHLESFPASLASPWRDGSKPADRLPSADAQAPVPRVQVGVLECRGGDSIGFIIGSVTNLGCALRIEGVPKDRCIATT